MPFAEAGQPVPQVSITCHSEVPLARGRGSSSAALVGGLVAGTEICGSPLTPQQLLELAAKIEGHPDNVTPALLGGCQIAAWEDDRLITCPIPVPEGLRAVLFIPSFTMLTKRARRLLPRKVSREDAVYNIGRVALLVRALSTGDLTHLAAATADRLHQPARQEALFPAMGQIFRAALAAGAVGVFLSGAGSTVLALARGRELTIGYEMADAAAKCGLDGTVKITSPTLRGAQVVERRSEA
jgi:homoserine kinase